MSYPPQIPMPAPNLPGQMPVRSSRNVLGIIAMIVSIVGFVFACIPGALIVGWVLLPISFVLGLVAVFRRGETRWQAITAIIVAIVGTVVGVVVFLVVVTDAVDDAFSSTDTVSVGPADGEPSSPAATARIGTRDKPSPLGTEISSREWKVVVNSVTFDADAAVLAANQFNEAPEAGNEYVLVNYSVTYLGDDPDGSSPAFVTVDYVSADGVTTSQSDTLAVAPDAIDSLTTLYRGGSVSGNMVLSVPSANAQDGVLAVEPGLFEDKVFVSVK